MPWYIVQSLHSQFQLCLVTETKLDLIILVYYSNKINNNELGEFVLPKFWRVVMASHTEDAQPNLQYSLIAPRVKNQNPCNLHQK